MEIRDTRLDAVSSDRGILYPARLPEFRRIAPPPEVAPLVRWFWIPEWQLAPGRVSRQHLIAFPACNLVVEPELVGLAGPTTRASHRDLKGRGWAVGALLRPAAVPTFADDPGAIRDRYERRDLPDLHRAVRAAMIAPGDTGTRHERAVAAYADWLATCTPPPNDEAGLANAMADLLDTDATVRSVADAARALHVSVRTMQRLATKYVGMSPSAMIRRRRLQEAAEQLRSDPDTDVAAVATRFGYSDHAHLANDFRTVLGLTPSGYRRGAGAPSIGRAQSGAHAPQSPQPVAESRLDE